MSKRLSIGLAPPLAIAVFAAMPATAQAAPHIYKDGVRGTEGKTVREIWWGTLTTKSGALGTIECHDIAAGFEENPTGGAAAHGKVQGFVPYECVSASCTALGGKATNLKGEKLPWQAEVIEPKTGEFREKITGVTITTQCEGVSAAGYSGETDPQILNNGLTIGSLPGEVQFQGEEGLKNGVESLPLTGAVKDEGYAGQELIEVKNP